MATKTRLRSVQKQGPDEQSVTLVHVNDISQVPDDLVKKLHHDFNYVIEEGKTYPNLEPYDERGFGAFWFAVDCVILVREDRNDEPLREGRDWDHDCIGTYTIKPNYMARCSHICNGGFMTCVQYRGKGWGKILAESFLHFAPRLGYKSSVFNLVFVTNQASIRLWDRLGFQRVGVVQKAGQLKGHDELVDAIIFQYIFPQTQDEPTQIKKAKPVIDGF